MAGFLSPTYGTDTFAAAAGNLLHVQLDPKDSYTYNNRGTIKLDRQDVEGAIADFSRALELQADYAEAYFNRGVAKRRKGDVVGADADRAKAVALDPRLAK